jgi:hypothetical protein
VALEYLWDNGLGAQLSAGYLAAPLGTSRNWTVGLGLNYHLSHRTREAGASVDSEDYTLRGIRLNDFGRRASDIFYRGRTSDPLGLLAVQADHALNENWYVAAQLAVAANRFRGYAGFAEGFVGLGWQTNLTRSGRLQGYARVLAGVNDLGITSAHENGLMLFPAVGLHDHLNDRLSIYGQRGATHSIGQYISQGPTTDFENDSFGLGMSYRFSLLSR